MNTKNILGLGFGFMAAIGAVAASFSIAAQPALAEGKPVIGINCDVAGDKPKEFSVQSNYVEAITRAGGLPVLLPPMSEGDLQELLPSLDGVLLVGGADYPPVLYGQKAVPAVSIMHPDRSTFDLLLVRNALNDKTLPMLGICAGCQAINIGAGGTLNQDIPSMKTATKVAHASPQGWQKGFNKHDVTFVKDTHLGNDLGLAPVSEPTSHHQCVAVLGEGIKVSATAGDGLIEGIEMPDRSFVVGVQFHPERHYERNQALFNDFITNARNHQEARKNHKLKL